MDEDLAVVLGIGQSPDHRATIRRQRLEQIADLGRRQRVDQPLDRAEPAGADRLGKQAQLACGLVVAGRFGHGAGLVDGLVWRADYACIGRRGSKAVSVTTHAMRGLRFIESGRVDGSARAVQRSPGAR